MRQTKIKLLVLLISLLPIMLDAKCYSQNVNDFIKTLSGDKKSVIKSLYRGHTSQVIYSSNKKLLYMSRGHYQGKQKILIFKVLKDTFSKIGEFSTSRWYGYHCLTPTKAKYLTIRTNTAWGKTWSEKFDIEPYQKSFILKMMNELDNDTQNNLEALKQYVEKYKHKAKLTESKELLQLAISLRDTLQEEHYKDEFKKVKAKNTINHLHKYNTQYPNSSQRTEAVAAIYELIELQNNIVGYEWFIAAYKNAKQVKEAIEKI
ncbi:hypothetical protein N9X61_04870 [Sulfurimonas sp.]|nr:hypothetical protein [Sulfurimonas sp.]